MLLQSHLEKGVELPPLLQQLRVTTKKGYSMFKIARFGVALVFGLLLAITLLAPGASAQSVKANNRNANLSTNRIVTTAVFQGVNSTVQASNTQQATQQLSFTWRGWRWHGGWGRGWGGYGGGWGGWGGGWGGWGGGWGGGCGCGC
jgi:CubicO group peptidase (beta-lactamase class C family)